MAIQLGKIKNTLREIISFQKRFGAFYFRTDISRYVIHVIISMILGVLAGLGSLVFHYLLEQTRQFFEPRHFTAFFHVSLYFIIFVPVFGGILTATLTRLFPDVARERGVVSVIRAIIVNNGIIPLKVTLFHFFSSVISIGTGAPLGPEGPVAKIGSGIGSYMSQIFNFDRNDMMMYTAAGGGAAIAAVFNAPITGVFFGIEVILLNDLKNRALSSLIIASVFADVVSRATLGNNRIFHIPSYKLGSMDDYLFFLLLGVAAGLLSIFYVWFKGWSKNIFTKKLHTKNVFLKIIPVSLIFGIILIHYYQLFGIGYETLNDVFNNRISFFDVTMLLILQVLFLALFLAAGAYGGTFTPSMSIGAFLGSSFATTMNLIFHTTLDPITFALVGMGGVLAGFNSIPLTAIMLVFEVTNDYKFILPLMLVSVISYLVTIYYTKMNVHSLELLHMGIDVTKRGEIDLLSKIKVKELMKTDFDQVNHNMTFRELLKVLLNAKYGDVFVVDNANRLLGIISLKDVREALVDTELVDLLIARDLTMPVPTILEDDPVSLAIRKIEKYNIENIPVVKSETDREIVGILTHHDIIQAYNKLIRDWETNEYLINY